MDRLCLKILSFHLHIALRKDNDIPKASFTASHTRPSFEYMVFLFKHMCLMASLDDYAFH